jgi:hypothetical protein
VQVPDTTADFEYRRVLIAGLFQPFQQLHLRGFEALFFETPAVAAGKKREEAICRI